MGAARSVLAVLLVFRVEADEGVGALVIPIEFDALNAAVGAEKLEDVLLSEVHWEVLGVDVVVNFAEVTFVAGLVPDDLVGIGVAFGLEGTLGARGVLEANEAVAA